MTWTCLRVQLRQERRIVGLLTEARLIAYAPMETRKIVVKHPHRPEFRRTVPRTRALIPGYVFVDLPHDDAGQPEEDAINAILSIRLVREIMSNAFGKPRKVDLQRLGEIILMDAFRLFDETYEPPKVKVNGYVSPWARGDRVKGRSGLVKGWAGVVIGIRGRQQVEVLFERDGVRREVKVDDDNLTQDSPPQPLALAAA